MRGTVLGYADGKGVIVTDDDHRFSFTIENWRETQPPARGAAVDFVARAGTAEEIYFSLTQARAAPRSAPGAQGPTPMPGAEVGAYLANRPGLVFAGLILFGTLLPFFGSGRGAFNLWSAVGTINQVSGYAANFLPIGLTLALWSFLLLYAIPGFAAWLIFREVRGEASAQLRMRTGIVGLATPFVVILLSAMLVAATFPGALSGMGRMRGVGFNLLAHIGIGWIIIIAASIALVAVGRGWSPFGKPGA